VSRCYCGFLDRAVERGLVVDRDSSLFIAPASGQRSAPHLVTVCPGCEWRREYLAVPRDVWAHGGTCHFCADLVFPATERIFVSRDPHIFVCSKCVRFFDSQGKQRDDSTQCRCGFLQRAVANGLVEIDCDRLSVPHAKTFAGAEVVVSYPVTVCPGCDWRREPDLFFTSAMSEHGTACRFCATVRFLDTDRVFASRTVGVIVCLDCVHSFASMMSNECSPLREN
jgi:hypothetical protein